MSEQAKARQEACCNASETEYFGARSQIDTLMQRHSFCAGFYRGYAAAIAAAPAQERIDALELEVRQLTEQIARLRHAPAPQADSQPAPVLAYPPLPDLDGTLWLAIGQNRRAITNFETTLAVKAVDTAVHGLLRAYVDADRAARAPADSVLEDAARWQMAVLVGKEVMLHPANRTHQNAVKAYMDAVHSGLDLTGAVDAARKQGANHD